MPHAHDSNLGEALLRHRGFVEALARRLTADLHEADDLAQETFLTTLCARPETRGDSDDGLGPWLARVLRNTRWTRRRASARRVERERRAARPEAQTAGAEDLARRLELQQGIVRAVLSLDEPYRGTVLLRYYEEASLREIAERQGVPLETARTRLRRAHAVLRARLGREHGDRRGAWLPAPSSAGGLAWSASRLALIAGGLGGLVLAGVLAESVLSSAGPSRGRVQLARPEVHGKDVGTGFEPIVDAGTASRDADSMRRATPREPETRAVETAREAYWAAVLRARREAARFTLEDALSATDLALLREVEAVELARFVAGPVPGLEARAREIEGLTGIPIAVDPEAEADLRRRDARLEVRLRQPVRLSDLFGLLVQEAGRRFAWTVHDGAVHVGFRENVQPAQVVFFHSLADLQVDPADYFAEGERRYPVFEPIDPDDVATIVQEGVAPGTWELEGVVIELGLTLEEARDLLGDELDVDDFVENALLVRHAPVVQDEVQRTLDHLRRFFVPDPERGRPGEPLPGFGVGDTATAAALRHRLDTPWGVDYVNVAWSEVAREVEGVTGLEVHSTEAFRATQSEHPVTLVLHDSTVREVLCALEGVDRRFRWRQDFGRLVFESGPYTSGGRQRLVLRDVRDLFFPPVLTLADLPFDEGPAWAAANEWTSSQPLTDDRFDAYLRDLVAPETWDEDPANSLRIGEPGVMLLSQTPRVLDDVDRRLELLRKRIGTPGR